MLYIELQLRKPETICEMFSVAFKVTLSEGSGQELQFRKKERFTDAPLSSLDSRGKNRTRKMETFTLLNVSKKCASTNLMNFNLVDS